MYSHKRDLGTIVKLGVFWCEKLIGMGFRSFIWLYT